jgi:cytidylate kinase
MSVIAISETAGSLGTEIGRSVAVTLGYELADREIITKAADRFGETPTELVHATEEKPTLWDRLQESQSRYMTYVHAIIFEMAAADNVVLVGRGAGIVLHEFSNVLRVRVTASEPVRARRIEESQGLTADAAEDHVRRSDRERGARLKFLYHVDWEDPLRYDLLINTDRIGVPRAAQTIVEVVREERFQTFPQARRAIADASLTAQAKAGLLKNPLTRGRNIFVSCRDATVSLTGNVETPEEREAAESEVARIPGVRRVTSELVALGAARRMAGAA